MDRKQRERKLLEPEITFKAIYPGIYFQLGLTS
jgi:hypothetical protein